MLITLTTDFGHDDAFVGIMKGVIFNIAPGARIVDICHQIEPGRLVQAAYVLQSAWRWFPKKTVHVVVVDPGVGSERKALAAECKGHRFVGPDNGVLTATLGPSARYHEISNPQYFHQPVSSTFHGRDVFAPAGAWLAKGTSLSKMGSKVADPVALDLPIPEVREKKVKGQVVYIDRFGNLTSNITARTLKDRFKGEEKNLRVKVGAKTITGLSSSYNQRRKGSIGAIVNSWDMLEIFCSGGHAARKLGLKTGAAITASPGRRKT